MHVMAIGKCVHGVASVFKVQVKQYLGIHQNVEKKKCRTSPASQICAQARLSQMCVEEGPTCQILMMNCRSNRAGDAGNAHALQHTSQLPAGRACRACWLHGTEPDTVHSARRTRSHVLTMRLARCTHRAPNGCIALHPRTRFLEILSGALHGQRC